MANITQQHLNEQLQRYCDLNGGMYNYVHICAEDELIPPNFDLDTIVLQRQGRHLMAYWHENGKVVEKALRNKDVQSIYKLLPQGGMSQNRKLINKIIEKYRCNVSPNLSFIENNGNCNGWSFLYPYYVSTGREQEFKILRKYIAKWNGEYEFEKLPIELRNRYANGNELFQHIINDLVWFQHSPTKLGALYGGVSKEKVSQDDRKRQYSMLKIPGLAISDICYFGDRGANDPATIRNENVIKVMEFYAQWPDSWIDFTINIGGDHAVSAYITKEGKFKYYDSNNRDADVKELSARECVEAMAAEYAPYGVDVKIKRINLHKFHGPSVSNALDSHIEMQVYNRDTAVLLLKNAIKSGQVEFAEFLLREYITTQRSAELINQSRILTEINEETDKEMINLFVRYGADINQPVSDSGWTPLHIACMKGNKTAAIALMRSGGNINAVDASGGTPVHYAARFCSSSTMKYLINHGADLTVRDNNDFTLLHYAALGKNTKTMQEVLQANQIDVNAQDTRGNTALHYAVRMGMAGKVLNQVEMIKLLRQYKANRDIVNANNERPIDVASNPGAMAALRDRVLIRRNAMENMHLVNLHKDQSAYVSVTRSPKRVGSSLSSSSTPSSSPSSSSASSPEISDSSDSEKRSGKRPRLLGAIPVGIVNASLLDLDDKMKETDRNLTNKPISSGTNVKEKKAFFEDEIRKQAKENIPPPRSSSRLKKP